MSRAVIAVLIVAACVLAVVYFLIPEPASRPSTPAVPSAERPSAAVFEPSMPTDQTPRVVVVLDDFGASWHHVERCLALPNAVVIAVIPHLRDSEKIARAARAGGFEVILHQPMEPREFPKENPGKYGIYTWQSAEEVRAVLTENLASLGAPLAGVNNHMGSRATETPEVMGLFFDAFPRELIFLDSRTSEKSVAFDVARSRGIRTLKNNVFLDNVPDRSNIGAQFATLLRLAKSRGQAIGIGHVHSAVLLDVLETELPRLAERGVRLARITEAADGMIRKVTEGVGAGRNGADRDE